MFVPAWVRYLVRLLYAGSIIKDNKKGNDTLPLYKFKIRKLYLTLIIAFTCCIGPFCKRT
jgi:hypothetical protein